MPRTDNKYSLVAVIATPMCVRTLGSGVHKHNLKGHLYVHLGSRASIVWSIVLLGVLLEPDKRRGHVFRSRPYTVPNLVHESSVPRWGALVRISGADSFEGKLLTRR